MGLLALLHSLQHVYISALPPLYLLLRAEFNVSIFQIGLLGSVAGVISILQGPAGYLVERIGSKRLAVLSMLGCSTAIFLYSLATAFEFLFIIVAIFSLSARASAVVVYLAYQYPMCPMAWSNIGGGLTLTVMKFWGGKI